MIKTLPVNHYSKYTDLRDKERIDLSFVTVIVLPTVCIHYRKDDTVARICN